MSPAPFPTCLEMAAEWHKEQIPAFDCCMSIEIITPETNEDALRGQNKSITNFKDPELQMLIDEMIAAMREREGVGLAAPQVARDLQLAVIETLGEFDEDDNLIEGSRKLYVITNPKVIWKSRKQMIGIEGCLSLPGYLGEVERPYAVTVKCQDRFGRRKRFRLKGWDARIFQHEIDHLNGILYTDKLVSEDRFWTDEEYEEYRKQLEEETEKAKAVA